MSVLMQKSWHRLSPETLLLIPGQLGVYEFADDNHRIIYIGVAGGRTRTGLRGEVERYPSQAAYARWEVNMSYRTRHRELLMSHYAINGSYPALNLPIETDGLGKLSLLQGGA